MAKSLRHQKIFHIYKFQDKQIAVHREPFIKLTGTVLFAVGFIKKRNQTVIQIVRKKSILI